MICFARLPLSTPLQIGKELNAFSKGWTEHFNKIQYEGKWEAISLRSPGGKENIMPELMAEAEFSDTSLMKSFPSVKQLLQNLKCPIMSVRFLNLKAGAKIKPHRDNELAFEKGEARLHFPIITNPDVDFFVEETRIPMKEGECWYINANLTHSVINRGQTDRIHLVVDCKVNDWLRDVFKSGYKKTRREQLDPDNQKSIIKALRLQQTTTGMALADQLERELENYELTTILLNFLDEIKIPFEFDNLAENTFLPGLALKQGKLIIDTAKLKYPGDILHEAGHLACVPVEIRATMSDNLEDNNIHQGGEMMAIAWSYAACLYLKIDPTIVFHDEGYKGGSRNILENFAEGRYFGVPLLAWQEMTIAPEQALPGQSPFPVMQQWTCLVNRYTETL